MEFKKRFGNRRRTKPKKGLFLIALLILAILLWYKAEAILEGLF